MNTVKALRMKLVCILFLVGISSASASFEKNETKKAGPPDTMRPESGNVGEMELREAVDVSNYDKDRAQFIFHGAMVGFIITVSLFFIIVVLVKACNAPKDKDKSLSSGGLDVEKQLWI